MASYGLKYLCTFDPIGPLSATPVYKLEVLEKEYEGGAQNVIGAGVPVLHQWQTDDPKTKIKGSSLSITFVNEGYLPLESFYSTDDDEFKIRHWFGEQLLFEGFLVQDDCSEKMVDFRHEINLSANDNLGLLKDVAYNPGTLDRVLLSSIISKALLATGLELNIYVWGRIIEISQNELSSFLDQTLIDPQSFSKSETEYDDYYSILEKILGRFKMTLFQAKGAWHIMRWDELRYYSNNMLAYVYDKDFNLLDEASMDTAFIAGIGQRTVAETGLLKKILRPFQYVKETFNYKQPAQLLRNADLQTLGALITTYVDGDGNTVNEYEAPWWFDAVLPEGTATPAVYFIRVISDPLGNELERYMVVKDDNIVSYKIEANQGDVFKFSFSFKTVDSQPGTVTLIFYVKLTDGTEVRFAREPGDVFIEPGWGGGPGWNYQIPTGDNSNVWHTVDIESQPIPFDGLLYCFLMVGDLSGTDNGTYYKDIRFEYTPYINESTKIIGHTHKTSQVATIKQNEDEEIFIDTSPRNSISGTLFLNEMDGLLQKKTERWKHPYLTQNKILGDIITFEQMFWRRKPRTILEDTFYGLVHAANHISILSVFKYTGLPTLNFVGGTMEIDYKNNKFTGTLWEIWGGSSSCRSYTFAGFGFPMGAWSIGGVLCDGTPFSYSSISGDGEIPTDPICARVGSITTAGNIIVTEGTVCGVGTGNETDADLEGTYEFKYLYSTK